MSLDKIDETNLEYGDIVSLDIASQIKENINLLRVIIPVGEIVPIMVGIPGVPTPNSNVWQECDGSEIVNPNSPLRTIGSQTRSVPDLRHRYIKVANVFGESGQLDGLNDTYIFRHNHGGLTGVHQAPEDGDPSDALPRADSLHNHTIDYSFDYPINVEPPFTTVKWYMRIQ